MTAVAPPAQGWRGPERVLLAISALGAGGAERVIIALANHLVGRGRQVALVTFEPAGTQPYYPIDPRVELHQLGIPSRARQSLSRVAALRRLMRAWAPDLVIAFLVKINVLVALASLGLRVTVILSERNNPEQQVVDRLWSRLRELLYPWAWRVVTPSHGVLGCFGPAIQERGQVIPNPVELTPPPGERGAQTIVAVGRLVHQKGFDLLLRAFAEVARMRPGWELVIFGEGEERERLERLRAELGLEGRVRLPGVTAEPGEWVRAGEVFVLSSRFESFGNVVTEAMAGGLAVVAFDCPFGPGEIVRNEVDGLLVAPGDAAALSSTLLRVTGDPALRARLGAAARVGVRRFAPEYVMARWEALIEEAGHGRRRQPRGATAGLRALR